MHNELRPGIEDVIAILQANNKGVGYMEQYEHGYPKAEEAFREVIKLAPGWRPGRINLGMALLNQHESEAKVSEAVEVFKEVLQDDPDNPYANYCLGIIAEHRGEIGEALTHFKKTTDADPGDAYAWLHQGSALINLAQTDSPDAEQQRAEAAKCFRKARALNPYLEAATYQLGMLLRQSDMTEARKLLYEGEALKKALWADGSILRYSEMGPHAEAINPLTAGKEKSNYRPSPEFSLDARFRVDLHQGARWAKATDFGTGPVAEVRRRVRARFGSMQVVLDYDLDGKPDLLLLGAVVEGGLVRDLLLHNEGNGRFTDVTHQAGLAQPRPSLGCCVADFDNDGFPDLIITGAGEQHLFRNTRKGGFEEVSQAANLSALKGVCLGAAFVDLDQDGDLDLVLAQYAESPAEALKQLASKVEPSGSSGLVVYLNVGEAPPHQPSEDPPLNPRFERVKGPPELLGKPVAATAVAFTDLDNDHDLDLVVLADWTAPEMVLNDRLLRFHRQSLAEGLAPAGRWNGALVLDAKQQGRGDLFLVRAGDSPVLLLNQTLGNQAAVSGNFARGSTNSPPLVQAGAVDLDLDGWPDIVGLSDERKPTFLQNQDGRLVHVPLNLGKEPAWPTDLISVVSADLNADGFPDLLMWSESSGLQLRVSKGNENHAVLFRLGGRRIVDEGGLETRCNSDGIGTRVIVQSGDKAAFAENSTQFAGLGQSSLPLLLGLGPRDQPDVTRFRWPDNVWQAEFNLQAGHLNTVKERNRKSTSCPVIFTWNGERFVYVTDFIGAGNLGEMQADGACRQPRAEESVKIESAQLALRDGQYLLKIAQPMQEVVYLDWLELLALDHPADTHVYPDERFSSGPPPSQDILAFRKQIFPDKARDEKGRDVTQLLRRRDRNMVDGYDIRRWPGFAADHWIELDFGNSLARFKPEDPLVLCTVGWTNYPYPESIWAAAQGGVPMQPPVLERQEPNGTWSTILPDAGFPAGQPRLSTLNVTGKLTGASCKIRLRTNMQVYYDQIFVAPLVERIPLARGGIEFLRTRGRDRAPQTFKITGLDLQSAVLETRGSALEYTPDGKQPTLYDYDRLDTGPVSRLQGFMTRTGDVAELLRANDDRHVIFGPGEEITVRFDAARLANLPRGWKRSFVLRAAGYTKDNGPFSATGATIEPLPFKAMSRYPYGPEEKYPTDELHERYRREYNTRYMGPDDDVRRRIAQ
jgi:hypothetical protein